MFTNLLKAAVGTILLPVDIIRDTVTLGGAITDDESAIANRLKDICDNLDEATK